MRFVHVTWGKQVHVNDVMFVEEMSFPEDIRWTREQYLAEKPKLRGLLAKQFSTAIGCVLWQNGYLHSIAVIPSRRCEGLARQLLDRAEIAMRLDGQRMLSADVEVSNKDSIRLFERAGWTVTGRDADLYGPGRDGVFLEKLVPGFTY